MTDSTPSIRAYPSTLPEPAEEERELLTRSADNILSEMRALNAAGRAVTQKSNMTEARDLVRIALADRSMSMDTVEDRLTCAAMAKVIGAQSVFYAVSPPPIDSTWENTVKQTVAHAWIALVEGDRSIALDLLPRLRARQYDEERVQGRRGGVNLMAMYFWMNAVEALARDDRSEAERLWKRALEVGSHFGTDSTTIVSWTYVATFFPTD